MRFSRSFAAVVALSLVALVAQGCGPFGRSRVEAKFRTTARRLYEDLATPSCPGAAKGFDRAALLERQRVAVAAFESGVRGRPAAAHLAIARADAAYELARTGGCFADGDVRFAQQHVEMTREGVQAGLELLTALAGSVRQTRARGDAPAGAAEFRFQVRELRQATHDPCSPDADTTLGPARAEVGRFRARLRGSPYAAQFDVADADAAYLASITMVECAAPDPSPAAEQSRKALAESQARIATLEAITRAPD